MYSNIVIRGLSSVMTPQPHSVVAETQDIHIFGSEIKKIGPELHVPEDSCVIDGQNCVALPGMINTHHHFYQILTRAIPRMQNAELFPWLIDHYDVWQELTEEGVYWSTLAAMGELLLTGCTCTSDHHYLFPSSTSSSLLDCQFNAAEKIGIRFLGTRGSMSLGKTSGGLPPDSVIQNEEDIIKDSQRIIERFHDPGPRAMFKVALAPCSPFSVSENLMVQSAALARSYQVRLHTHLAETKDEEEFCINRYGCRPVALMEKWNWLGSDVWFAHCVHLNSDEIKIFAETGTGTAHCPSSNMRLGSGIAPISELLKAGAHVGLAVDGSASNDSSDMLGEVRQALLLQRVSKGAGSMTVKQAFDLGTVSGARMLGFNDLGLLEEGKPADIALFRHDGLEYSGVHDLIAGLILAGNSHRAETVLVNGQLVVEKGKLVHLDEQTIKNHCDKYAREMVRNSERRTGKTFLRC